MKRLTSTINSTFNNAVKDKFDDVRESIQMTEQKMAEIREENNNSFKKIEEHLSRIENDNDEHRITVKHQHIAEHDFMQTFCRSTEKWFMKTCILTSALFVRTS